MGVVKFFEFALSIFKGLFYAVTHDVDVFLLGVSAVLLSITQTRWVGVVFLVYTVFRRLDQYVRAITSKADQFVRLMDDEDTSQRHSRTDQRG